MNGPAPAEVRDDAPGAAAPLAAARQSQWGTVAALTAAVLLFGVADGFAVVALPLGVLLLGLSTRRRWWWVGVAVIAWVLAFTAGAGGLGLLSRGWGLVLGGAFLATTLAWPRRSVLSRSLAALAVTAAGVGSALALSGGWEKVEWAVADHFRSAAALTSREIFARLPNAGWAADFSAMSQRMAETQGMLFPALLALQSLAALALVWWGFARSRGGGAGRPALCPLREFRFNDRLVWVLIAGLLLVLLPLGDGVARTGYNALLFMGALYMLRGLAVFVFLARGAPTVTSLALGAIAAVFFYPLLVTAALLVGVGDTWLDVRGRVMAAASRA